MIFTRIAALAGLVLLIYLIYVAICLFRKIARTYYVQEDGRFRCFGDAAFSLTENSYLFHDYWQRPSNRYQGYSSVEKGFASIYLRKDPSYTALNKEEVWKAGHVDLEGNIYAANGTRIGYITDAKGRKSIQGSGKWYELWLRKHSFVYSCDPEGGQAEIVGKVIETGRLRKAPGNQYTATSRAGGYLLLYRERMPAPQDEDALILRTTWKDTALPAAVVYTFLYGLFYSFGLGKNAVPAFGESIGFILAMTVLYFIVWALLRQVKIEQMLSGRDFDTFLQLVDRNTGVGGLNNWILFLAAASLGLSVFVKASDFIPLQLAILVGVLVNKIYIDGSPWEVVDSFEDTERPDDAGPDDSGPDGGSSDGGSSDGGSPDGSSPDDGGDDGGEDKPGETDETVREERRFNWELDSSSVKLAGAITLSFDPQKIAVLREQNPFRTDPAEDHMENIRTLFAKCEDTEKVRQVVRYVDKVSREKHLSERDKMQFILDFVQKPNIQYAYDEDCDEIGNIKEYARFPDETMYDGRGDCDCKAALAAILYREAGHKVAYVTTQSHAAIAVAFKQQADPELARMAAESLITNDGYLYFFCETTGDGFKIGDLGSTMKDDIEDTVFLN